MLMGFISLLLTVLQQPISNICIPESVAATWHPCAVRKKPKLTKTKSDSDDSNSRKLLHFLEEEDPSPRRFLATKGYDKCADKAINCSSLISPLLHFSLQNYSQPTYQFNTRARAHRYISSLNKLMIPSLFMFLDQGKVAFVSSYGIHQLHIFIFVLAIFHVLQCIITLALGRTKVVLLIIYSSLATCIKFNHLLLPSSLH